MPWRRFVVVGTVAASLSAVHASMLGYAGGSSFEHRLWKPLAFALGIAAALAAAAEAYRRLQRRRGRELLRGQVRWPPPGRAAARARPA